MSKRTNKLQMENILVGNGDQVIPTGSMVNATTSLGLLDNQLGFVSWDFEGTDVLGDYITPGATVADVKAIKAVQGTPGSADISKVDPFEWGHKANLESGIINANRVQSVTVRKPRPAKTGSVAVTDIGVPTDLTEYGTSTRLDSVRIERDFGSNDLVLFDIFTTPDYTTLGTVDPKDHMLQNLLYRVNTRSSAVSKCNGGVGVRNVLALGINVAGGTGVALGTITCGDTIPVLSDNCVVSGTPIVSNVIADLPLLTNIAQMLVDQAADASITAPITAASTIEVIDLTTAGTAATVDAFVIVGLEEEIRDAIGGFEQGVYNTMTRVEVELTDGFQVDTAPSKTTIFPVEAVNDGRAWYFQNQRRAQLGLHTMQSAPSVEHSLGQSYVDKNTWYTSEIVDYYDYEKTLTLDVQSPKQLVILLPATITCVDVATMVTNIGVDGEPLIGITTADSSAAVASTNTVAGVNGTLNTWLESARSTVGFSLKGDATAGAYLS